eukprot:1975274-Lingulodinium_polyedra.AAC.1
MERASVRLASRCGCERRSQPQHCVELCKRCTTMRPNRPSAAAAVRKSQRLAHSMRTRVRMER